MRPEVRALAIMVALALLTTAIVIYVERPREPVPDVFHKAFPDGVKGATDADA